jgi:hypothetical protein
LKRHAATPIIDWYSPGALTVRRFVDSQGFR